MKKYIIIAFLFYAIVGNSQTLRPLAKESASPLTGTWTDETNNYRMTIYEGGHGTFNFKGITERYYLRAVASPIDSVSVESKYEKASAIAISLVSIERNKVATLSGQINYEVAEGQYKVTKMEVWFNTLALNSKNDIEPGVVYGETLIFNKMSESGDIKTFNLPTSENTNLNSVGVGEWKDLDTKDKNNNSLHIYYSDSYNNIYARYIWDGKVYDMEGFTASGKDVDGHAISLVGTNDSSISLIGKVTYGSIGTGSTLDAVINKALIVGYTFRFSSISTVGKFFKYKKPSYNKLEIPMSKIDLTNNGSANWISNLNYGTPAQNLKIAMDTGGSFNWVNSTQCTDNPCKNYGHHQFNLNASSSFEWLDKEPKKVNWGPWGDSMANTGEDNVILNTQTVRTKLGLITQFDDTAQFQEFLWDGAFAMPSYSSGGPDGFIDNIVADLVKSGVIYPIDPFSGYVQVSFYYDDSAKTGKILIGGWDQSLVDLDSKIVLPQTKLPAIPYLWTTKLSSVEIGNTEFPLVDNSVFSLDTGSSSLKGLNRNMIKAKTLIESQNFPDITYTMGKDKRGNPGKITLTKNNYQRKIEQGEKAGSLEVMVDTNLSDDESLAPLWLQGTTLMDAVYTVFNYQLVKPGTIGGSAPYLKAKEIWMFNKKNGQKVIRNPKSLVEEGTYYLKNRYSGQVASVTGGGYNDGQNVIRWPSHGATHQRWKLSFDEVKEIYTITAVHSEKVLDVSHGQGFAGNNVWQYHYNGTPAQQWTFHPSESPGFFNIKSELGDFYLMEFSRGSIGIFSKNGHTNQDWEFVPVPEPIIPEGIYYIKNSKSEDYVNVVTDLFTDGQNVTQGPFHGDYHQRWKLSFDDVKEIYTIAAVHSEKVLDVRWGRDYPGNNVWQYHSNGTPAQQWTLHRYDLSKFFNIKSKLGNLYLTGYKGWGNIGIDYKYEQNHQYYRHINQDWEFIPIHIFKQNRKKENNLVDGVVKDKNTSIKKMDTTIFPNPSTGTFTISSSIVIKELIVKATDGSVVWQKSEINKKNLEIDIGDSPIGVYMITAYHNNGEVFTSKVIKK